MTLIDTAPVYGFGTSERIVGQAVAEFGDRAALQLSTKAGRRPEQMEPLQEVWGWSLDAATLAAVDSILAEHVPQPVGPEFMAPPTGLAGARKDHELPDVRH